MEAKVYPVQGCFELTARCNFNCRMCYVRSESARGELTAQQWLALAEQAIDAGTLKLTLTGGEPLARHDFSRLYSALTEMGFQIYLKTNLSLFSDEILALLEERPPWVIQGTLYGACESTYKKVCGVDGAFEKVLRGISEIQRLKIPLRLVSTVIRENSAELEDMYKLANSYGIKLAHTNLIMDTKRNENHDSIVASRVQYNDLVPEEKAAVKQKLHMPSESPLSICGNYKNGGYWVLRDGSMSFCSHIPLPYYPLKSSIEACFYEMRKNSAEQYAGSPCAKCELNTACRVCPAVVYTENIRLGTEQCRELSCCCACI